MATGRIAEWFEVGPRLWVETQARRDEEARRTARLAGERAWPGLEFIDVIAYNEGEFLGYFLGAPYDWNILDPYLMKEDRV